MLARLSSFAWLLHLQAGVGINKNNASNMVGINKNNAATWLNMVGAIARVPCMRSVICNYLNTSSYYSNWK